MSDVKRYNWHTDVGCMIEEPDGGYVEAADYDALRAELSAIKGAGEAVAYLDIGAGGYVDLGTNQAIEALEKLPYGRHMLGIIGTYGADGWQPKAQSLDTDVEPVAYAAFADNGNVRVWSRGPGVIEMMAAQGCKAVPLYARPPVVAEAEVVAKDCALFPVEPTEEILDAIDMLCDGGFDDSRAFWSYLINAAPPASGAVPVYLRALLEQLLRDVPETNLCARELRALLAKGVV